MREHVAVASEILRCLKTGELLDVLHHATNLVGDFVFALVAL
jgi:hypothetical protein